MRTLSLARNGGGDGWGMRDGEELIPLSSSLVAAYRRRPAFQRNAQAARITRTTTTSPGHSPRRGAIDLGAAPDATRPATTTPARPSPATSPDAASTPGLLSAPGSALRPLPPRSAVARTQPPT